MPSIVMRESPGSDFYVYWSSVVEAPIAWGTRAEVERLVEGNAAERFARADATGTSCLWVQNAGMRDEYPEVGSWEDDSYIYQQEGTLTRAGVFEVARRLADGKRDMSDLLTPFEDEEDADDDR